MTPGPFAARWLRAAARGVAGGNRTLELVGSAAEPAIAAHSARTFRYAAAIAAAEPGTDPGLDPDVLFHACLLHDIGTTDLAAGLSRFEVAGADLAARTVAGHGFGPERQATVWQAVALHTSPQIAERMGTVTRLVRLGVRADFGEDLVDAQLRAATERDCPRLDIERVLSAAVVRQCLAEPERAPSGTWPAALLAAHRSGTGPDARLAAF